MVRRLLALAAALVVAVSSLPAAQKGIGWNVESVSVSGAGDSLFVRIVYNFTPGHLPSASAFSLIPVISKKGGRVAPLTPVSIYGPRVPDGTYVSGMRDERRLPHTDKAFKYVVDDRIPMRDWMDTVSIVVRDGTWSRKNGYMEMSAREVARMSRPPCPKEVNLTWRVQEPLVSSGTNIDVELSCPVVFDADGKTFNAALSGDAWKAFMKKVKFFTSEKSFSVRSASLVCYSAPEPKAKESLSLSKKRVQSVGAYLRKSGAFLRVSPSLVGGGTDWDGFSEWVRRSRYGEDARLLELIGSSEPVDAKVARIRLEKPTVWEALDSLCFPYLQRVVLRASFRKLKFSSPRFYLSYMEEFPESLTAHDFWYISTDYERSSTQWLDIILAGAEACPDDAALNLNAAFGLMERDCLQRASVYLRRADLCAGKVFVDEVAFARALWFYKSGRFSEFLATMQELKGVSTYYSDIWDKALPFVMWEKNLVPWQPVLL